MQSLTTTLVVKVETTVLSLIFLSADFFVCLIFFFLATNDGLVEVLGCFDLLLGHLLLDLLARGPPEGWTSACPDWPTRSFEAL